MEIVYTIKIKQIYENIQRIYGNNREKQHDNATFYKHPLNNFRD